MLEVMRQLLILQERDRKILLHQGELAGLEPQRQRLTAKAADAQHHQEEAKVKLKQIESDRKKAELEVEASQQQIAKYALQQYQTKKNEEYRALAHEIESCKATIRQLEDQQLDLMEQAEQVQKELTAATRAADELARVVQGHLGDLTAREQKLHEQLAEFQRDRSQLTSGIAETFLARYERLLKHRREKVLVGIEHGVCGGCHMILPPQVVLSCQSDQEILTCPNCGRLLYYSPEMDLSVPAER